MRNKIIAVAAAALSVPALCMAAPDGQKIFQQKCKACHRVNGVGGKLGPDLSNVAGKFEDGWMREKLLTPKKNNPKSIMPPYRGDPEEVDALVGYLKTLK